MVHPHGLASDNCPHEEESLAKEGVGMTQNYFLKAFGNTTAEIIIAS